MSYAGVRHAVALVALWLVFSGQNAAAGPLTLTTNQWAMAEGDIMEHIAAIAAPRIAMDGRARDDSFWFGTEEVRLSGWFENDAWVLSPVARLQGSFSDHARVLAQTITVDGQVSNGLWAVGLSIGTTTNSMLIGDHFLLADTLSLLGNVEGNIWARSRRITLGGTIHGNVRLYGDDIVIRPGTIILGNLTYTTTNRPIVLDNRTKVSGELKRVDPAGIRGDALMSGGTMAFQLFWFAGALLTGCILLALFPAYFGRVATNLNGNLWRCGLAGVGFVFTTPFVAAAFVFILVGIPFALVLGASYGIILYLGKIPVALAIGSAILRRSGSLNFSRAVLGLVIGLILYYSLSLIPLLGESLQMAATAFGAGSLILSLLTVKKASNGAPPEHEGRPF